MIHLVNWMGDVFESAQHRLTEFDSPRLHGLRSQSKDSPETVLADKGITLNTLKFPTEPFIAFRRSERIDGVILQDALQRHPLQRYRRATGSRGSHAVVRSEITVKISGITREVPTSFSRG